MNPNMSPSFNQGFKEQSGEWLAWLGFPNLYDGGLFVVRSDSKPTPEQERQVLQYNLHKTN